MGLWTFQWVDRVDELGNTTPASVVTNLSPVMLYSLTGAYAPPFHPVNAPIPLQPGSFLKFIHTEENEIDLTILVQGSNYNDLWSKMATYPQLFSPVKRTIKVADPRYPDDIAYKGATITLTGNGKLVITGPGTHIFDGNIRQNVRELICRCTSGFKIDEETLIPTSVKATLTFYANQPYWRNQFVSGFDASVNGLPPQWFNFFKINLGPGPGWFTADFTAQGGNPIVNNGDVDCPLIWIIKGPGRDIKLINQTTNQTLSILGVGLGQGETLTINTALKTVVRSGISPGNPDNWLKNVTLDSEFWSLAQGSNDIRVQMNNANAEYSDIQALYHERYFGVI